MRLLLKALRPRLRLCLRLKPATVSTLSPLQTRHLGVTMPHKRKRTDAVASPTRTDGLRRSSRIKDSSTMKDDALTMMDIDTGTKAESELGYIWKTKEGVQRAMRELSEMEHKFQDAVRTQRLAVENSDLKVDREREANRDFRPEPYTPRGSFAERRHEVPGMPGTELETAPMDSYEVDLALGDLHKAELEEEVESADRNARRPPPVNSDQLPLPWTGRLGYACLNTYLRSANPPVFSSRTCRMNSIVEHRHPLRDPSQPEHPVKNRPDKDKPPSVERGQKFVQELGLANARDIVKMLRWNDKYGIKFMRLSSEMFPFASHEEHGYRLEPFAAETLAEAGKVAAELGHRLTTHPGQFTQIGSPRKEVVAAAVRDLAYHDELLSLLKLPEQMDRDAVMILHMGGTYGDKAATLNRFRENYKKLPDGVKRRLVLENDDVAWSVHDLLPICEELNIPLVLDFHHHNIIFDASLREGTLDITKCFDRIQKTWTRKRIRQKMHYSEQCASATTPRERRKHSPRVKTLPPCAPDMDLMIEAKDKEQAVFELMRTFKLPGWDRFNDVVPFERDDESRKAVVKKPKKGKRNVNGSSENEQEEVEILERRVSEEDLGMGGPENRVYWPEGMEEWLRPRKREVKKKGRKKDEE